MRLFRKKQDSLAHQEYLDGLITSIRRARRVEEEKPDLQAFVEEDGFPMSEGAAESEALTGGADGGVADAEPEEVEEIANLEAYLSKLNAEEATDPGEEVTDPGEAAVEPGETAVKPDEEPEDEQDTESL